MVVVRALVALPLALAGAALFAFLTLPWPAGLRDENPERTSFMEYRLRQAAARGESLELRQTWVPLERISGHARRAVIVAEDGRFYEHHGVDWAAIREELRYAGDDSFSWTSRADLTAAFAAVRYYREHRDQVRGRSTITQQLAKNLYFTPDRSPLRKAEEFMVARRLERFLDKDRILEIYLNTAEWGPGIFGIEAAARHYFGRGASELTREQAAALAATLPHPLTSNPAHRPNQMAWRQRLILDRMGGTVPAAPVPLEPPGPVAVPVIDPIPAGLLGEPAAGADTLPRDSAITTVPTEPAATPPAGTNHPPEEARPGNP